MESIFDSIVRPQSLLGQCAPGLYQANVNTTTGTQMVMVCIMPDCKNSQEQNRSDEGSEILHFKYPIMRKWLATMVIVLRPLMRELLKVDNLELCDQLGPFTNKGVCFDKKQLLDLFQYVGRRCVGLAYMGYNIFRSIHVSDTCLEGLGRGKGIDDAVLKRIFNRGNHGESSRKRNYHQVSHVATIAEESTFDHQVGGVLGAARMVAERMRGGDGAGASSTTVVNATLPPVPVPAASVPLAPLLSVAPTPAEQITLNAQRLEMLKLEIILKGGSAASVVAPVASQGGGAAPSAEGVTERKGKRKAQGGQGEDHVEKAPKMGSQQSTSPQESTAPQESTEPMGAGIYTNKKDMVKRMRELVAEVWSKCKKDRKMVKSDGTAVGDTLGATLKRLESKPASFKNTVFNEKLREEVRKIDSAFEESFFKTFASAYKLSKAM